MHDFRSQPQSVLAQGLAAVIVRPKPATEGIGYSAPWQEEVRPSVLHRLMIV